MSSPAPAIAQSCPPQCRYRVTFHDGVTVTTSAPDPVTAEMKALRTHRGFVDSVRFLGKVAP